MPTSTFRVKKTKALPETSNLLSTTSGWNLKVCDRAISSLPPTSSSYRQYAKQLQSNSGQRQYEAAAHLVDLIDATGSQTMLHRLSEAKGYYHAATNKSALQEITYDDRGRVVRHHKKAIAESGGPGSRLSGAALMSPHGMDAENAQTHAAMVDNDGRSSPSFNPMSPDSMVKHAFHEHPDSTTPTKTEMLRRAGLDDFKNRTAPVPDLHLKYISDSHASRGVYQPGSSSAREAVPEEDTDAPLGGASMIFAAATAMRTQRVPTQRNIQFGSSSLPSSPRKASFEKRYKLDQKIKEAAKKLMSPTTIKTRSKTAAMIDGMRKFVDDKDAEREEKNAWRKGGGFSGRKSEISTHVAANVRGRSPGTSPSASPSPPSAATRRLNLDPSPVRSPAKAPMAALAEAEDAGTGESSDEVSDEEKDMVNSPLPSPANSPKVRRRTTAFNAKGRASSVSTIGDVVASGKRVSSIKDASSVVNAAAGAAAAMRFKRRPAPKPLVKAFVEASDGVPLGFYSHLRDLPEDVYIPLQPTVVTSEDGDLYVAPRTGTLPSLCSPLTSPSPPPHSGTFSGCRSTREPP